MEKSSNIKEEIYKIVKYQTKLAESSSREQQDLYRYKISQHVNNLSKHGVKKDAIKNIMQGGQPNFKADLQRQKEATIQAIKSIRGVSDAELNGTMDQIMRSAQNALEQHKRLQIQNEQLDDRYRALGETYKVLDTEYKECQNNLNESKNVITEVEQKALEEAQNKSSEKASLALFSNRLNKLFENFRGISDMPPSLSQQLRPGTQEESEEESEGEPE